MQNAARKRILTTRGEWMAEEEELVTIGRYRETFEAELAKGRLDSAGIPSFLVGENTALLYGTGLGGLQLQVSPKDEADALTILNDPGTEATSAESSERTTEEGKS
jgi:Putative prokaryotic signal transducing protein